MFVKTINSIKIKYKQSFYFIHIRYNQYLPMLYWALTGGRRKARRSKRSGGNICRADPGRCTDAGIFGGGRSKARRSKRTCRKRSGGRFPSCASHPDWCNGVVGA